MPALELLGVDALRDTLRTFRDVVHAHSTAINLLNVYPVPDGDTGTNMARTLEAVVDDMDEAPAELVATCDAISHGALMGARGNSGVILSQILRGVAATLKGTDQVGGPALADALEAATTAAYAAVLKPVEGTILTVIRESAEGARRAADGGAGLVEVLRISQAAAVDALARTPEMLPVLADAGVVDAGGAGIVLLFAAALNVVTGEPLPEPPEAGIAAEVTAEAFERVAHRTSGVEGELDVSEQRYEVMYLCHLADEHIEDFKQGWGRIGDSIVVVGGDGIWNCHVHTNDIGAAVETALELDGRPFKIRVTDLFEEVAAEHASREAAIAGSMAAHGGQEPGRAAVACAVVAVSSGDGISAMFRDLGVHVIVKGGQTLNPSTAELLDAVERANAGNVVLLPGNKNIIPVAEQVDALSDKTVRVVPTRSMPEGLAALMAYDPEADAPANALAMRQAADAVVTGEVTRAVRASRTAAGPVAEGDWMGIVHGDGIIAIASNAVDVTKALLEHLVDDARELVTLITGADAEQAATVDIVEWFGKRFADVELEVHDGGQPLYPYLLGVE